MCKLIYLYMCKAICVCVRRYMYVCNNSFIMCKVSYIYIYICKAINVCVRQYMYVYDDTFVSFAMPWWSLPNAYV